MTFRSVILGLAAGLFLAAFGYFNDWCLKLPYLASTLVPPAIFGLLVVSLLVANPLLRWLRAPMRAGEWVVILALALVGAVVPGPSLGWQFGDMLIWPHQHNNVSPGWREHEVLSYVPPRMLADASERPEKVVGGFIQGLDPGGRPSVGDVPWRALSGPLGFYMPLLALGAVATVCTAYVLHGHWSRRERLRYPVAEFTSELVAGSERGPWPDVFRNRKFWVGFGISFGVLLINGLHKWYPGFIQIPLSLDLTPMARKWPMLSRVHFSWVFLQPRVFFVAVGFAYFLSSEISFSIGFSYILFIIAWLVALESGVHINESIVEGGVWNWQIFGAYLGMMLMIVYVGRRYYADVLRRAVCLPAKAERVGGGVAWAARVALLCGGAMVGWLIVTVRLDPFLSVLFVGLTGLMFIVLTRINAETGLIIIQPRWHVIGVCMGAFGFDALGPNMFIILAVLSLATAIDPRSCLMPMVTNGLRFSELRGVRSGRLTGALVPAALLALAVGVPATLYVQYAFGQTGHFFWGKSVAKFPFSLLARHMDAYGRPMTEWHAFSFAHIDPNPDFLWAAGVGLAAVLVVSFLRLRYTWWPIHPVMFLVFGVDTVTPLCASFLVGWAIKTGVMRFGGSRVYRAGKPVFVGLIAGEFVAGLLWAAGGLARYLAEGTHVEVLRVHPF